MALKITIASSDVVHMASPAGRLDNFGYKGWRTLAEYLENLSDDLGYDIEVDIIGICCDYSMAESTAEYVMEYGIPGNLTSEEWEELSEDEKLEEIEEFLIESTSLVHCSEDLIIWQAL